MRKINDVDRMLSFEDVVKRSTGKTSKARRRTVRKFGQLEVVVVEETDEPTQVFLANGDAVIVRATVGELEQAAASVREILSNPPPIKRRSR